MSGKKLKVYLDNCCYNRPFDEARNTEIGMESNRFYERGDK